VPWFREGELKNGRAAMLATVGFVVPEFVRIPGDQFSFEAIPRVIDAHDKLPDSMIQIFAWISFLEACQWGALANMNVFDRDPGDFGFDPLKLKPKDAAKYKEMQLAELKVRNALGHGGANFACKTTIFLLTWSLSHFLKI
jgi:light-harvesting complex I chlorophyll a/b binding protein 4